MNTAPAQAELEARYTCVDLASRYHVKVSTVQGWVRKGRIKAINLGGERTGPYVFRPQDIEEFEHNGERGAQNDP